MKYYSPSTQGFYDLEIGYTNLPEDLIEITEEEHDALFAAQGEGKRIIHNDKGLPTAELVQGFTPEQQWQNLRDARNKLLTETDWTQCRDVSQKITDKFSAYRQTLRDLPQNTKDPLNVVWPVRPA